MEIKRLEVNKKPKGYKLYLDLYRHSSNYGSAVLGVAGNELVSIVEGTNEYGFLGFHVMGDNSQLQATHYIDIKDIPEFKVEPMNEIESKHFRVIATLKK